ncbi:alpha-ketoglutarate-dependent dioxygenase alkB homolog 6-like [Antedon mediterranea]|uniref:alpha-ketoglutarate-dependent dioxygenase alkB homolog 6-like n=1 Tax=Antedon mediterranea TaxID=105859 RepID=UPI003AF95891
MSTEVEKKITYNDIEQFCIQGVPSKAFYIPNFITPEEEKYMQHQVYYGTPKPQWTTLLNRRLQQWGGNPHPKGMVREKIPQWLDTIIKKIVALGVFGKAPNHVLINEYEPGQGIMPHEDGPLFHPVISTVNLGSHTLLDFYPHQDTQVDNKNQNQTMTTPAKQPVFSLLLEPRSLLLLTEDMYKLYLHGIDERLQDTLTENVKNLEECGKKSGDILERGRRISLTIRNVPKVLPVQIRLGKR